jgi:hypothetical protein
MIALEEALSYVGDAATAEQRAVARLKGQDTLHVGSRWLDEAPADVLVPLLGPEAPADVRQAVVRGWRSVLGECLAWLAVQPDDWSDARAEWVRALCWVVEIARPADLREGTGLLLSAMLDNPRRDSDLLYEVLSAWRSCGPTVDDWGRLERLLEEERLAAIAFDTMLQVNARDPRLERYLFDLWCRRHREGWRTDVVYLAAGLEEKQGGPAGVVRVLRRLMDDCGDVWPQVRRELEDLAEAVKKDWPREWLRLAEAGPSVRVSNEIASRKNLPAPDVPMVLEKEVVAERSLFRELSNLLGVPYSNDKKDCFDYSGVVNKGGNDFLVDAHVGYLSSEELVRREPGNRRAAKLESLEPEEAPYG